MKNVNLLFVVAVKYLLATQMLKNNDVNTATPKCKCTQKVALIDIYDSNTGTEAATVVLTWLMLQTGVNRELVCMRFLP
jgi:hypothetical protein